MNATPTPEHYDILVEHLITHLPDSFRDRKAVLTVLLTTLPADYDRRREVVQLLHDLRAHDASQLKLVDLLKGGRS